MIDKLISGVDQFHREKSHDCRTHLAQWKQMGANPMAIFICCIDARTMPNLMTCTAPGELFAIRNVGNTIPAHDAVRGICADRPESAALEYAVGVRNIREIIVCGHSDCAAIVGAEAGSFPESATDLRWWARHISPSIEDYRAGKAPDRTLPSSSQIAQIHVLRQIENLRTLPIIRERLNTGDISLHPWFFDIENAEVQHFDSTSGRFVRIETREISRTPTGANVLEPAIVNRL